MCIDSKINFKNCFEFSKTKMFRSLLGIRSLGSRSYSSYSRYQKFVEKERHALPSRPLNFEKQQLTNVVESKAEFEFVEKLLPSQIVPEPPKHDSYPTPSGWVPVNVELASKLPYAVLRTRFHQFPMYPLEREGGSRKLVRIKNIEGDIWVG